MAWANSGSKGAGKMTNEEDIKQFFKYAIYVPFILTLFLEWLNYMGNIKIGWLWVLSPLWVWVGGAIQFIIGGMLTEFFGNNGGKK